MEGERERYIGRGREGNREESIIQSKMSPFVSAPSD